VEVHRTNPPYRLLDRLDESAQRAFVGLPGPSGGSSGRRGSDSGSVQSRNRSGSEVTEEGMREQASVVRLILASMLWPTAHDRYLDANARSWKSIDPPQTSSASDRKESRDERYINDASFGGPKVPSADLGALKKLKSKNLKTVSNYHSLRILAGILNSSPGQ
jgi:hypothetical protein